MPPPLSPPPALAATTLPGGCSPLTTATACSCSASLICSHRFRFDALLSPLIESRHTWYSPFFILLAAFFSFFSAALPFALLLACGCGGGRDAMSTRFVEPACSECWSMLTDEPLKRFFHEGTGLLCFTSTMLRLLLP